MPKKGYKRTKEHTEKIRLHLIGRPVSEETRKKISESEKGKIVSIKTRKLISKFMKGRHHSPATEIKKGDTGEKSRSWKGGHSRCYNEGYYSAEYVQWRKDVFKRDNYTCQECGENKNYVTAHHIKSFAHFPELRFDIENGLTLCEDCHKLTDNYNGRGKRKV